MDDSTTLIDRTSPSNRPSGRAAGTQCWKSLLFLHWEVPVDVLQSRVPVGLKIDTFDGRAFVGVVPFMMRDIRPNWLPRKLAFNFLETNVRTYVVHRGRPGVFFFSLDANSRLAVWAARLGWSLPYFHAAMTATENHGQRVYESRRRRAVARHRVSFRVEQELGPSLPETLEHFLLERYLLFVQRSGQLHVGQVHHSPYHASTAVVDEVHDELVAAAGLPAVTRPPDLAHYCPGVDVEVFAVKSASG